MHSSFTFGAFFLNLSPVITIWANVQCGRSFNRTLSGWGYSSELCLNGTYDTVLMAHEKLNMTASFMGLFLVFPVNKSSSLLSSNFGLIPVFRASGFQTQKKTMHTKSLYLPFRTCGQWGMTRFASKSNFEFVLSSHVHLLLIALFLQVLNWNLFRKNLMLIYCYIHTIRSNLVLKCLAKPRDL